MSSLTDIGCYQPDIERIYKDNNPEFKEVIYI